MKKFTFTIVLTLLSVYTKAFNEEYIHQVTQEQMDYSHIVPEDYFETFQEKYGDRKLQQSTPQPIRITFDYTELDKPENGEGLTPFKKQYLKNISEAASVFLNKLIKVYPRTKPIKRVQGPTCKDVPMSDDIQNIGVSNTDLHIYITYQNDSSLGQIANGIWCTLDPNPVVGRIKFNIATMKMLENSPQTFQDYFSVTMHEIIHCLGFASAGIKFWIDPDTGMPLGLSNVSKVFKLENRWGVDGVMKLFSKNILRVARSYYGCPTLDGFFLENQGNSGSMNNHFERDILNNEFMTASSVREAYSFSEFTAAILLDTGFFAEINSNMLNPMYWGKNKGCDFVNKACNSTQSFTEFPDINTVDGCDYFGRAISKNKWGQFSQCNVMVANQTLYCNDKEIFKPNEETRQNTGAGSKCFKSNASMKGYNDLQMSGNCFKMKCSNDSSSIQVYTWGDEFVNCLYPNQQINLGDVTKTTKGILYCPHDFDLYCNFPRTCPNYCSYNGVCNNGYCICRNGYAGEDCSIQCPSSYAWDGSSCVSNCPNGLFKNFNNVCKSKCPQKQYANAITGTCELCNTKCSVCNGPGSNQCTSCNIGYTLSGNYCIEGQCHNTCLTCSGTQSNQCTSCSDGKYLGQDNTCQPCKAPCNNCLNENQCTSCIDGFSIDINTGLCMKNVCDNSCLKCSAWRDPNKCSSCVDGYFLTQQGKCQKCENLCSKCIINKNKCTECISGYTFDEKNQRCYLKCDNSCLECSVANDSKSCTSCVSGKYLFNGQCMQCDSTCATCQNSAQKCTACVSGYVYQADTFSCKATQCHSFCKTCSKNNDQMACNSCRSDMYLLNGQCFACLRNCATCSGSASNCTSCPNGFELKNGGCFQINVLCHSQCRTCSENPIGNKTFCTSCNDGKYLQGDSCLPCSPQCKTCGVGSFICLSCDQNLYDYNSTKKSCDNRVCHASCKTCTKSNDSFSCSSCPEGFIIQGSQCKPCQNGKCDVQTVRKSTITCDQTCSTCIGIYYDQCSSCAGNRILEKKNNLEYGYCNCSQGTTDVNQPICQVNNNLQSNVKSATTTTFAASTTTSALVSASTSNPVVALGLMEFSQSVSYLQYVNKRQAVGFDETMNTLSYSHSSNLINLNSYAEKDSENEKKIKQKRRLQQSTTINIDEEDKEEYRNPKFTQNNKTQLFLINALILIIINATVWIISGLLSLIQPSNNKNSLFFKLCRIYNISIPIIVFSLSSQEFSLLMFLQMLNLKTVTGLQILSTIFSFLTLFYIIGFIIFLFYFIEYKRVLSEKSEQNQVWQQRFYLIYKYIKQNNFFTRNFVQITVLRKVIISFITACIYSSPIAQITLLILCYTTYLIYLIICKPFNQNLYTAMMIIIDAIILVIHILYCVLFSYEGDSDKEKVISLMMLFLTFIVFFAYLVYTLIIIVKICYNLYKKWLNKKQNSKVDLKNSQVKKEDPRQLNSHCFQKVNNPSSIIIQSNDQLEEKDNVLSGVIQD